jgi:hypothetical protein
MNLRSRLSPIARSRRRGVLGERSLDASRARALAFQESLKSRRSRASG